MAYLVSLTSRAQRDLAYLYTTQAGRGETGQLKACRQKHGGAEIMITLGGARRGQAAVSTESAPGG